MCEKFNSSIKILIYLQKKTENCLITNVYANIYDLIKRKMLIFSWFYVLNVVEVFGQ